MQSQLLQKKQSFNNIKQGGVLLSLNIAKGYLMDHLIEVEHYKTFFPVMLVVTVFTIACSGIPTILNVTDRIAQCFSTYMMEGVIASTDWFHNTIEIAVIVKTHKRRMKITGTISQWNDYD